MPARDYGDYGDDDRHADLVARQFKAWLMRTVIWVCSLYILEDAVGWTWSFLRYVIPNFAPR